MKIIFWVILTILLILLIVWYLFRRKWAIRKVKCTSDEEKIIYIDAALEPFGFAFDYCQDIVISKNDSWQRDFGYMDLYDLKAPFLNMVFDCEPICFEYDGKEYRVEFWKGQYGITTGAEVGVYVRDNHIQLKPSYYRAAHDDERLNISFKLIKRCDLFSRCDKSWWLTGFDIGLFSRPKDLAMDICICFPNKCMLGKFLKSLMDAGYSRSSICVCDKTVCFQYCCPNNYKLNNSHTFIKCVAQIFNYVNCRIYNFLTRFFNSTLDKLTYLRYMSPCLYRLIINLCLPRKKKKHYHKKIKKTIENIYESKKVG